MGMPLTLLEVKSAVTGTFESKDEGTINVLEARAKLPAKECKNASSTKGFISSMNRK